MAGPTATHGVEEVRRSATGTQAPGSGHHQGRTGHDRDTGGKYIISRENIRSNAIAIILTITRLSHDNRQVDSGTSQEVSC